jgi:hypothetical protein
MAETLNLDWSTAEVSDGTLSVHLNDKPPKEWRAAFTRTAQLLSHGQWEVEVDKKEHLITVSPISGGDEGRVRQFLEGSVHQANAAIVDDEDELYGRTSADSDGDGEDEDEGAAEEPETSVDEEATSRFRAFADEGEPPN